MAKSGTNYRVRIDEDVLVDLSALIDHKALWDSVMVAMSKTPAASSVRAFAHHVARTLNTDPDVVSGVVKSIWNLRRGQQLAGVASHVVIEDMSKALARNVGRSIWTSEQMQAWNESKDKLIEFLDSINDDSPLMMSSKAQHLIYDRENILRDLRIITDVRPVFNESAENLCEMIITHNLVLEYEDKEGRKEIYLALDKSDIASLRSSCDRAEAKSRLLFRELDGHEWRIVEFPESSESEEN